MRNLPAWASCMKSCPTVRSRAECRCGATACGWAGWVNSTPLTSGAYLSVRTDASDVSFDDIEVYHAKK